MRTMSIKNSEEPVELLGVGRVGFDNLEGVLVDFGSEHSLVLLVLTWLHY